MHRCGPWFAPFVLVTFLAGTAGASPVFSGPLATMTESSLPETPRRITVPPASLTVYAFDVR